MIDLFLCHNSADKDLAKGIGEIVESTEWNGRTLKVFLDSWDIAPGENIIVHLNAALDQARYVAVLLSPEMVSSEWCAAEVASILATDPTNRAGRLLPIRIRDEHRTSGERLNVPPFLRALVRLDFSTLDRQRADMPRLLAHLRGERPPRGARKSVASAPVAELAPALPESADIADETPEDLIGNVVAVREIPSTIWSAPTALRSMHDLPPGVTFPPLVLREDLLLSFHHPSSSPLASVCQASAARPHATREWRGDASRWRWVIELLNRSLRAYLWQHGVDFDGRRFFFAAQGPSPLRLRWGTGTARTVVRPPDADRPGGCWVHQGARLRFETLGSDLYLSIYPIWIFTTDGRTPVGRETAGPLAMKWGGRERNGTILRHVLMWCDVLAQGKRAAAIACGDQRIVLARLPGGVRSPVGVVGDRIRVRALLEFTRKEQNLDADPAALFGLTAVTDATVEDDDGEDEAPF
ncbi:MAG: toll/interleukin-1 receptor domain-containing protein [Deltaproteobacteria bacterium]|nr:toll/interleukin-1 receptor domain-containing protein [Deltaproteobacteria bacterium]